MARIFGHVAGAEPGKVFSSRAELAAADVHRPREAGISGSVPDGADSIVAHVHRVQVIDASID